MHTNPKAGIIPGSAPQAIHACPYCRCNFEETEVPLEQQAIQRGEQLILDDEITRAFGITPPGANLHRKL